MAKIIFSPLVSGLRGKIGGTIFQGGRYGFIARQNFYPFNPSSEKQKKARGRLSGISKEWKDLTFQQRASWAVDANSRTQQARRKKVFTVNVLSPFDFFVQTNYYRALVKETQVYSYPGKGATYGGKGLLLRYDKTTGQYFLSFTQVLSAGIFVLLYSTRKYSAGVSNFAGKWVFSGFFNVVTGQSEVLIDSFWEKQFTGTIGPNETIGFKTLFVSANGVYTSQNKVTVRV